jgi:DNA adenine methylase
MSSAPLSRFASPLRYPGGKGTLANFFKLVIQKNQLLDGHYAEVYAGGAGVAWPLLFGEYVQRVHINDLNKSVFAFWDGVLHHPEELCRLINDTPVTIEEWRRQRAIQLEHQNHSQLELAFSTFFLNRTNRSGIISAGVIGGKTQIGKWKLDARYNKQDLVSRIERIARYADRINLYNLDAAAFISDILQKLPFKTLVYLDPPYFVKGGDLYEDSYTPQDHATIARTISTIKQPWVVSYDDVEPIEELYHNYRKLTYNISYSAQVRYAGAEVMFFGPMLVVPRVKNVTKI